MKPMKMAILAVATLVAASTAQGQDSDSKTRECVKEVSKAVNSCVNHGRGSQCEKAVNRAIDTCTSKPTSKKK